MNSHNQQGKYIFPFLPPYSYHTKLHIKLSFDVQLRSLRADTAWTLIIAANKQYFPFLSSLHPSVRPISTSQFHCLSILWSLHHLQPAANHDLIYFASNAPSCTLQSLLKCQLYWQIERLDQHLPTSPLLLVLGTASWRHTQGADTADHAPVAGSLAAVPYILPHAQLLPKATWTFLGQWFPCDTLENRQQI